MLGGLTSDYFMGLSFANVFRPDLVTGADPMGYRSIGPWRTVAEPQRFSAGSRLRPG